MIYFKLFAGIGLLAIYFWLLSKRAKKYRFADALFNFDIIVGLAAGIFLVAGSAIDLFSSGM